MATSLSQAKAYIYNMDLTPIIEKMTLYGGWLREDALLTSGYYRNYLFLRKKYNPNMESITPENAMPASGDVDEFWHMHILDTRQYISDCQSIFGGYLHHYPYLGIDGKSSLTDSQKAFERLQTYHLREFGTPIAATRSRYHPFVYSLIKFFEKNR